MAGKSANSPRGDAAPSRDRVPSQSGKPPDPGKSETDLQAWHEKILAVQGDDKALLQLAHQAPGVELKLAALAGVTQEDALRQAEREFRDHDKRVYRAAKSRNSRSACLSASSCVRPASAASFSSTPGA